MLAWIVVLIVAVGELGTPETRAVTEVLQLAAPEAQVRVTDSSPESAIASNEIRVVLRWESSRQKVELEWTAADRSVQSSLVFSPSDAPIERGRSVGLVLASLMPEPIARAGPTTSPPSTLPRSVVAPKARDEASPFALELIGTAGAGLFDRGVNAEFGGAFGVRYRLLERLSLRADFRLGGETFPSSSATGLALGGTVGASWALLSNPAGLPLRFELALDLGIAGLRATHFSADDLEPVTRDSVMFAAVVGTDLFWELTSHFGLLAHFGMTVLSTEVALEVLSRTTATRGFLRLDGGLGVRVTL